MTDILKKYYKIFKMSGQVRFGYGSMYTELRRKDFRWWNTPTHKVWTTARCHSLAVDFGRYQPRDCRRHSSRNDIIVQSDTLVRGSIPCCMSLGQSCVRELTALPEHLPDREGAWAVKPSRRFESWCSDWLLIILFLERHLTFNSWVSFYCAHKKYVAMLFMILLY